MPRKRRPILQVGTKVKIVKLSDESANVKFLGRVGTIRRVQIDAGVGETEYDPFYQVAVRGVGRDGFWREEMQVQRRKTRPASGMSLATIVVEGANGNPDRTS